MLVLKSSSAASRTSIPGEAKLLTIPNALLIGRIGALAVALGIGTAMATAGIAHAEGADGGPSASSSNESSSTSGAGPKPQSAGASDSASSAPRSTPTGAAGTGRVDAADTNASVGHHDAGTNQRPATTSQRPATTARSNTAATRASKTQTPSGESTGVTSTSVDARTTPKASEVTSAVNVETASSVAPTATSSAPAGQVPATPEGTSLSLTLLAATRREPHTVTGNASPSKSAIVTQAAPTQLAAAAPDPIVAKAATTTTAAVSATTTGAANVVIEAESLALTPSGAGEKYQDSTASGKSALLLASNSTVSSTVSLPASTNIVIRARGDQFLGAPSMTVSVDGKVVSTAQVSSTTWLDYNVPVTIAAGVHTVSVAFTNDLYVWGGWDRNLRLDNITVVAKQVTTPPPTTTPPTTSSPSFFQGADWLWKPISSSAATAANSATWVSYLSATGASRIADLYDYGVTVIPASAITSSTPRYDVKLTQPWGSDPFGTYTVPIPLGTKVPPGSDGQITVQDPLTGKVFGIWQAKYDSATNTWSGSWGGMTDLKGNGVDGSGSATASNISRYAGVITAAEFSAAVAANSGVNHALVFATDIAGPAFVGPATKSDGANLAGVAVPIPEGYRIQLDPSINVDAIPGITAGEKVIAKTLQTYGAYVVDQGSARMAFAFETVPGATKANPGAVWTNAGLSWDYYDMAKIPWSKLRVLAPAAG